MLESGMVEAESGEVRLSFSMDVIIGVLEFLYTDEIVDAFTEDTVMDLLFAATQLCEGTRMVGICESVVGFNIDVDNCLSLYKVGQDLNLKTLQVACEYFTARNYRKIKATDEYAVLLFPILQLTAFLLASWKALPFPIQERLLTIVEGANYEDQEDPAA